MSERQAKRLRRATRAYIRTNKTSLAKGAPVYEQADARVNIVRELWPRLNHRIPSDLNGALRALGIAVPS